MGLVFFEQLLCKIKEEDTETSKRFTRISENFHYLLTILRSFFTKQETNMRDSISAEERLVKTFRFMATGTVQTIKL